MAAKAGMIRSGRVACEQAVRNGQAHMLMVASDTAKEERERFEALCGKHHCICIEGPDKEELGRIIGKTARSYIVITDQKMADVIRKNWNFH